MHSDFVRYVIGVDEAGRGPIAGPVSVGVVMVPEGFDVAAEFPGVADSKTLSEKKREKIFALLEERVAKGDLTYRVEFGEASEIDNDGIVPTIRSAVARAIKALTATPEGVRIFLDGSLQAPSVYTQDTIVRGDATVPVISLASIAAKVSRDRLMHELAKTYPDYAFEQHKGYGTKLHYELLTKYGPCATHRRSFLNLTKAE